MRYCFLFILISMLSACTPAPPKNVNNLCAIFHEYPRWYWAAQDSQRKWGVPISVSMAIIHQESRFRADAKPPRRKILWIIPWSRPTTAYGYSQALNNTWKNYQQHRGSGRDRDAFTDAIDFIGWYSHQAHERARISPHNASALYLAYHEGIGGYMKRSYRRKAWLSRVAQKVSFRSRVYHRQLVQCRNSLPSKPWWHFW